MFDNAPEDEFEFWASEPVPLLDQDTPVTTFDATDEPELLADEAEDDADLVATFNDDELRGELLIEDEHIEEVELTLELRTVEDDAVSAVSDDIEDEEPPQLESDASLPEQAIAPVSDAELLASTGDDGEDVEHPQVGDEQQPDQAAAPATDAELLASASDELDEAADADEPLERVADDVEVPGDLSPDGDEDEPRVPGVLEHDNAAVASNAELIASNDGLDEPDEVTDSLDAQLIDAAQFVADNSELLALIDLEEAELWDLEVLAAEYPDALLELVRRLRTLMGVGQ